MGNNIDRPNGATDEQKSDYVKQIEALNRKKESLQGSFMKECATINEEIKELVEHAKSKGIPKKSLTSIIKVRILERKVVAAREALEKDELEVFVDIRKILGDYADLPLGAAAVQAQGEPDTTTAAIMGAVLGGEKPAEDPASPEAIAQQKASDADAFAALESLKKPAATVTALDPSAARRNRAAGKAAAEPATGKMKVVGAEPGEIKF